MMSIKSVSVVVEVVDVVWMIGSVMDVSASGMSG